MSTTTATLSTKDQKPNPFAPKPKPQMDPNVKKWLIQSEGLGHEYNDNESMAKPEAISQPQAFEIPVDYQRDLFSLNTNPNATETAPIIPESFEAKEPVSTDVPLVYQEALKEESKPSDFSGSIVFREPSKVEDSKPIESSGSLNLQTPELKVGEALGTGVQNTVKVTSEALSSLGGASKDTLDASLELITKDIFGLGGEKKSDPKADAKKQEQAVVFQHTRSFNQQLDASRHQIDMTLKMKEALRIIEKPDMGEEEAVALGFNANLNSKEFLMNAYGQQSLRNKKIEMQKLQEKRKVEQSIKETQKPAVVLAGMNEGGTAGGKVNMSAANAAG